MRFSKNWVSSLFLVALLLLGGAGDLFALPPLGDLGQIEKLQTTLAGVAEAVAPTVVAIRAEKRIVSPRPESRAESAENSSAKPHEQRYTVVGSGIIIRADGAILTNEHVIDGADPEDIVCTLSNGDMYHVKAVISDHRSDLAVLQIDAKNLPEARLGDLKSVRQGHFAIVMGNPLGVAAEGKPAMSFGIISALGRLLPRDVSPLDNHRYYGNLIETDARMNLGNSGGPLLNIRGEVIGITTAISSRSGGTDGSGYAIPLDDRTKSIIDVLLRGEEMEYGYLGINLTPATSEDRRLAGAPSGLGVLITNVDPNTAASEARLEVDDLIVEFDGSPIHDIDQFIRMVDSARVGVSVPVTLYRDGVRQSVQIAPKRRDIMGVNYQPPLAWRGMTLADITPDLRDQYSIQDDVQGVVITAIEKPVLERVEAALRDEIQEGVVVNQVNGTPVTSLYHFKKAILRNSDAVKITLVGKDLAVEVTLPADLK